MTTLAFEKYEGLGNDFVLVEGATSLLDAREVIEICDRHLGVGADGVLFVERDGSRAAMRIVNADGSRAQMCGNGLRCVALHLYRRGEIGLDEDAVVETDAGPHRVRVVDSHGLRARVRVAMRPASFVPDEVPVRAGAPLFDAPIEVAGHVLPVTCISMGNPHAVTFADVGKARFDIGPALQGHPMFPRGVNVGFARARKDAGRTVLDLDVLERGAGWTRACGTGACAAAVAAVMTNRAPRGEPIEVRLPGGSLEIVVGDERAPIMMTGPARQVFSGLYRIPRGSVPPAAAAR